MGQWDNPRNIAMLFTGAFLVSLGLIALLNVEVHSRELHEPRIRNENLFQVIGRKISELASSWRERNARRRSSLYNFLAENSKDISPTMRKLENVIEDGVSENDVVEIPYPESHHPIRHEKKNRHRFKDRHNATYSHHPTPKKENRTVDNSNRTTVILFKTSFSENSTISNNETDDILKKKLDAHQNCYTTNEVLEIIAITCLVNFIFWFLIISCVNFCTKNQKVWKSDSCESLESLGTSAEYETKPEQGAKRNRNPSARHSTSSYNNVQDYVDSLTGETDGENHTAIPMQDLTKGDDDKGENDPADKESEEKSRFTHFSDIFNDMISLDNLKPLYGNKSTCREKHKKLKIMSSLSMENLIF